MCFANYCVFIVDDESLIAFQLEDLVKSLGAHAVTMSKSCSALETLKQAEGSFQLAIVDIRNANELCVGLLREISRQQLPVVLTTTDSEIETDLLADIPLRQVVVRKPFDGEDIRHAVRQLSQEAEAGNGAGPSQTPGRDPVPASLNGIKQGGTGQDV